MYWMEEGTWHKDVKEQVFAGNEEITPKQIGEKEGIILRVFRRGISKYSWSSRDVELTKQL